MNTERLIFIRESLDLSQRELAEILNVSGVASEGDMYDTKIRAPFWDNFEEELRQKLGDWLYTEFNNRGLKIPSLKNAKF